MKILKHTFRWKTDNFAHYFVVNVQEEFAPVHTGFSYYNRYAIHI